MMVHLIALIFPILLISCTTAYIEKKEHAWEKWKGLPASAISEHPYFKLLPVKKIKHPDGLETWLLRDQTRFQTDAYCQSLGGCMSMPIYNCDNAFSVKDGIILGFDQSGGCPGVKTIEAPKK